VIIISRFTGNRVFSHAAETRAQKLVAVQFVLLAPYVGFESVKALIAGDHPDVRWVGIGVSIGSVVSMPMLGIAKQRLADHLGSAATAGEGCCVASPLDGVGFADDDCHDGCCSPARS
jgi:hypothetical protein